MFIGLIDSFARPACRPPASQRRAALNALDAITVAMSFVIARIGFLGYRWLTRGERGSRLDALTVIAGSEG